jgi:hypothetical protein
VCRLIAKRSTLKGQPPSKVIAMYPKQSTAVKPVNNRLSTAYSGPDGPPTPRFVRLCSRHQCGPHLPWSDWDDVLAVLDDGLCILRLADTIYIMPNLADDMWGNA